MKPILLIFAIALHALSVRSQSNTPCGGLGAPFILVNVVCTSTNGNTQGASFANNAGNAGTPPCANPGSPDVWYRFIAPPGGAVNITTQAGTITDGGMALYSGGCPNNFNLIQCDDDSGPGAMPQINATGLTSGGIYYIRFWNFAPGTGTFSICLTTPSPLVSNTNCNSPQPICSGTPITFTANTGSPQASQTNPGNNYGCLQTSPNPSWYYLEIDQGGNLIIDVTATSDVDFAIWGPYANLTMAQADCNNYGFPQDCSYSTSAVEQVNLPVVQSSQVYILLVTNYANTIQNISVNNNGGTATTNCGVLILPVELSEWSASKNGRTNLLSWKTASESNSSHFAVQRSSGVNFWETISVVEAAGSSSSEIAYSFEDEAPLNGVNYYRLMQVDTDGKFTYSHVVSVESDFRGEIIAYPNPAKGEFSLLNVNENDLSELKLMDMRGNAMPFSQQQTEKGLTIVADGILSGIYFVQSTFTSGLKMVTRIIVE